MITLNINLILLITFITWHYALFCGYISDDHAAVETRTDIIPDDEKKDRGESFWVKRFNDGLIMFYQTRIFWSLGLKKIPFAWHLFSLGVHLANTYLLYIVLSPIVGNNIALYCCGFWAINPMLNQNVVWISGRPYLFGTFLSLIALICWQNPFTFMVYYMLAVITNISIFFLPVLLFIIHHHDWQPKLYLFGMISCGLPFLIWKFHKRFMGGLVIDRENFKFTWRKFNTFARVFLYYIWTLFVPVRMGWYHQAGFRYNEKWEKFNWLTTIGFLTLIFALVRLKLAGWWYLLAILPNSNLYATNSFLQDRYLYFCSIGIALAIAPLLAAYPVMSLSIITFYATRSYMYSRHLKDDESLYRENYRNHPKSDYCLNNLSYFLIQQKRYPEAAVIIERGLHINNTNKMLWYNLGITHAAQGHFGNDEGKFRFVKAIECWKKCLQIEPRWSKPAEDMKKLIQLLIDNKVLTLTKDASNPHGIAISVPNFLGMKEMD